MAVTGAGQASRVFFGVFGFLTWQRSAPATRCARASGCARGLLLWRLRLPPPLPGCRRPRRRCWRRRGGPAGWTARTPCPRRSCEMERRSRCSRAAPPAAPLLPPRRGHRPWRAPTRPPAPPQHCLSAGYHVTARWIRRELPFCARSAAGNTQRPALAAHAMHMPGGAMQINAGSAGRPRARLHGGGGGGGRRARRLGRGGGRAGRLLRRGGGPPVRRDVGLRERGAHVAKIEQAQHAHDRGGAAVAQAPVGPDERVQAAVDLAAPPHALPRLPPAGAAARQERARRRPPLLQPTPDLHAGRPRNDHPPCAKDNCLER